MHAHINNTDTLPPCNKQKSSSRPVAASPKTEEEEEEREKRKDKRHRIHPKEKEKGCNPILWLGLQNTNFFVFFGCSSCKKRTISTPQVSEYESRHCDRVKCTGLYFNDLNKWIKILRLLHSWRTVPECEGHWKSNGHSRAARAVWQRRANKSWRLRQKTGNRSRLRVWPEAHRCNYN